MAAAVSARRARGALAAARTIARHKRQGTCPSCGSEVETFVSLISPDGNGITFGCAQCNDLAAYAVMVGRRMQATRHLQN